MLPPLETDDYRDEDWANPVHAARIIRILDRNRLQFYSKVEFTYARTWSVLVTREAITSNALKAHLSLSHQSQVEPLT
jgi:hypothetical protein